MTIPSKAPRYTYALPSGQTKAIVWDNQSERTALLTDGDLEDFRDKVAEIKDENQLQQYLSDVLRMYG